MTAVAGRPLSATAGHPADRRWQVTDRLFAERRGGDLNRSDLEDCPYPFRPEPGGLISWGYDHSGDEHFFLPCDAEPGKWKILAMIHEIGCETFDGSFSDFVLPFVQRRLDVDRYHGIDQDALEFLEPEDLEELVASGGIGPTRPSSEPCRPAHPPFGRVRPGARIRRARLCAAGWNRQRQGGRPLLATLKI